MLITYHMWEWYFAHIDSLANSRLDVFTAIGVLLYMQTLEKHKADRLDQPRDDESLETGMKFLRMASRSSKLAARYVSTLEMILDTAASQPQSIFHLKQSTEGSNAKSPASSIRVHNGNGTLEAEEFALLENINPNDLLFGTGLPYDFLPTDWPNYEACSTVEL